MVEIVYCIWLLISLAAATFTALMAILSRTKKTETKKEYSFFLKKRHLSKVFKRSLLMKMDRYLKEAGYPYGITIEVYIFLNLITALAAAINSINGGIGGIKLAIMMLVPLNALVYYERGKRRSKIQLELCNIQDILFFQSRIGTPQDIILAHAAKTAGEPLKTPLLILSDKYKLQQDLGKALEEFRKTTDLMELQSFSFILEQRERTGFSEENHRSQAIMLKRSKRMGRRIQRAYKRLKLIIASILMFACYMLFATVPLIKTVFGGVDSLLK